MRKDDISSTNHVKAIMTKRLAEAIAAFDDDNIAGPRCDDRVAAILEAVRLWSDYEIVDAELLSALLAYMGGKTAMVEPPGRALSRQLAENEAAAFDPRHVVVAGDPIDKFLPEPRPITPGLSRLSFKSAGATRKR